MEGIRRYTTNKKIIEIVSNNKNKSDEVISIFLNLITSNRTQIEKDQLVLIYLSNTNEENKRVMKFLVCNSLMTEIYTFNNQKTIINNYLHEVMEYKEIVQMCYKVKMKTPSKC